MSQTFPEVEELIASIREMAGRVSAEFVPDQQKTQNFVAAGKQREILHSHAVSGG